MISNVIITPFYEYPGFAITLTLHYHPAGLVVLLLIAFQQEYACMAAFSAFSTF
jgi:hypothetical protein